MKAAVPAVLPEWQSVRARAMRLDLLNALSE